MPTIITHGWDTTAAYGTLPEQPSRPNVTAEFALSWLLNQYSAAILDGEDVGGIRRQIMALVDANRCVPMPR